MRLVQNKGYFRIEEKDDDYEILRKQLPFIGDILVATIPEIERLVDCLQRKEKIPYALYAILQYRNEREDIPYTVEDILLYSPIHAVVEYLDEQDDLTSLVPLLTEVDNADIYHYFIERGYGSLLTDDHLKSALETENTELADLISYFVQPTQSQENELNLLE